MKNKIVLPLFLGLVLAGCSRTKTDSPKLSSNEPNYDSKATMAANQSAADAAALAQKEATAQTKIAAATTPATDASTNASAPAPTPTPALESTIAAATPTPPASVAPAPAIVDAPPAALTAELTPTPPAPAPTDIVSAIDNAKPAIADRITEWKLTADDIKVEFDQTGRIDRSKTAGAGEPTGPMDTVLVSEINGKLKADTDTSTAKISIEADKSVVTLTGSARTLDQIGRAVALALDTGGVTQAISLIKLEPAL